MKYIVFKHDLGMLEPVIFSERFVHSVVAEGVQFHPENREGGLWTPVSAGFVSITDKGNLLVHGKSESMKMKANVERDQGLLMLRLFGSDVCIVE